MIDPTQWSQLGGLLFVARRLVEGMYAGRHASTLHGRGVEFHDYRVYAPGDDLRQVDWKVFGRSDRYYVRRARIFSDLHAYILVDASRSMHFAGIEGKRPRLAEGVTKLDYAKALAASIAYLLVKQYDRVGAGVCTDHLAHHTPVAAGWSHLQRLCAMLEDAEPGDGEGRIATGLAEAHRIVARRGQRGGMLILISDLLDEPATLFDALSRFRHDHFDVQVFQVLTKQELNLSSLDGARLKMVDPETRRAVTTNVDAVRQRYQQQISRHIATIRSGCAAHRIDHTLVTVDQPIPAALRASLAQRTAVTQ